MESHLGDATLRRYRRGPTPSLMLQVSKVWITSDTVIVRAVGEIDVLTVGRLGDALSQVATAGALNVVLDVAGIRYLGGAGLTALLAEREAAATRAGRFCIASLPPAVAHPLELSGLAGLFDTHWDLGSALAELICDPVVA